VRDVVIAVDGVDYVAGERGYRMLRAEFVRDQAERCRAEGLSYLAVHNHLGLNQVRFSQDDFASHERGYPALLQVVDAPVGALVFAEHAVAGDIWLPSGTRVEIEELTVIGRSIEHISSGYLADATSTPDARRHRQSLLFGDEGQRILRDMKIAVIGIGGIGSLLVEFLARLGVGDLLLVDPDRVTESNLSRVLGSREADICPWLSRSSIPMVRDLGMRLSTPKVKVGERNCRIAHREGHVLPLLASVTDDFVARQLMDSDFIFLAADSMQARLVFNALVHQCLIPGIQVGAKVTVDSSTGSLFDVFSVVRSVTPDRGCLWCNGLISPTRLAEEAATPAERQAQRYVDDPDVVAPSVITLNAVAAGRAVDDFLFAVTGLRDERIDYDYVKYEPTTGDVKKFVARRDADCSECGLSPSSRFAMGQSRRLPTKLSAPRASRRR